MTAISDISAWLAIGFGAYVLAPSIGGLLEPERWVKMFEELENSPSLQFIAGVLTFFLGFAILAVNPSGSALSVLVSTIGWFELIEGLLIFVIPRQIFGVGRRLAGQGRVVFFGIALAGFGLIAAGWFHLQ